MWILYGKVTRVHRFIGRTSNTMVIMIVDKFSKSVCSYCAGVGYDSTIRLSKARYKRFPSFDLVRMNGIVKDKIEKYYVHMRS